MFSYTHPPGASVAWPLRDERQGWHMPPTRGGRFDGGVNDAAAPPRAARLGKDEGDEDNRDRDGDTAAPERDPAGACRWLARARNAVAYVRAYPPRLIPLRPPIRAVQQRTFAAAARARPRARTARACLLGSAQMPGATSQGFRGLTGGASHRRRLESHRWWRDHQRDQRRAAATTGTRGAPVDADRLWPDVSRHAITSRHLTRDNCSYRESDGQISVLGR